MNPSPGLTRYRSAPSSYFSDIIDREFYEHIFNKPSSPETERVFSRFMNSFSGADGGGGATTEEDHPLKISADSVKREQDHQGMNNEVLQSSTEIINDYSNSVPHSQQSFYQSAVKPPLPNQNLQSGGGGNGNSGLIRHSSSPAGLFSQINIENSNFSVHFILLSIFFAIFGEFSFCLTSRGRKMGLVFLEKHEFLDFLVWNSCFPY